MLLNTPIPKAIKDSLPYQQSTSYVMGKPKSNFLGYSSAASDEQIMGMKMSALFFLEKDMHPGKKVNMHMGKDTTPPSFIPRQVADTLPFTSNKLQEIMEAFKVKPRSMEAKLIKKTVKQCEKASKQGDDQFCATSLESMVDFATSKLGKSVKAISTQIDGNESTTAQGYRVEEVRKLVGDSAVVCHRQYYAYAVHYCHKTPNVNAYMIFLVGDKDVRAKSISICHEDTSSWNPKHLAFEALNVKPGTDSVCHFLVEDEIVWMSN